MDLEETERLCDALAELASKGPSRDPQSLVAAGAILRKISRSPEATLYIRERANNVDRALRGWLDSDERFHSLLTSHSRESYALIDRLHSALREGARFGPRCVREAGSRERFVKDCSVRAAAPPAEPAPLGRRRADPMQARSEERRVGKECRSRWSPYT